MAPYLPADRETRILELGCGMGFCLMMLRDLGYNRIEGIDSDPEQVKFCQEKKLPVIRTINSQNYLDQHGESYDLVLAMDLIEHIPHEDQMDYVRTIGRSLKKGGVLICTVPNASSPLAFRYRYNDWTHHSSFTESSLSYLLAHSGFSDIEVKESGSLMKPRHLWVIRPTVMRWLLLRFTRIVRRLQLIGELGFREGVRIPLSLNLLARAKRNNG